MAKVCSKGHVNDDANRFCDQCGEPLSDAQPAAAPQSPPQALAAGAPLSNACPVCGQENVPGTAFCDNCGAALPPPQPAADTAKAQTSTPAATSTAASSPSAAAGSGTTTVCAQCGTTNDPANRFCENCGATLATAGDAGGAATGATISANQPLLMETGDQPTTTASTAPAVQPESASTTANDQAGMAATQPSAADAAPSAQAAPAGSTSGSSTSADRQRLEAQIATQQQVVAQLEQMQANFGAATPPAIAQGLEEARRNLAQSEAELQALTGGSTSAAPPVEATYVEQAATAPAAAEAAPATQPDGGATGAGIPPIVRTYDAPATPPAAPAGAAPQPATPAPSGAGQQPPTPVAPQMSGPRLMMRNGMEIALPERTKGDLVIGREDPVSGIHPDIDLTPHGGEAGGVSRRHAVLQQQNGQWLLTDLDSTNYTRVDGNRLAPNTPTALHDGARVQFGRVELEFRAS